MRECRRYGKVNIIMQTLRQFATNPLFGLFTFLAGILFSFILNYAFYRLSIRTKQPSWAINSNNLISGFSAKLPDLDIKYLGKGIENLTISKVMFWNAGNQTIEGGIDLSLEIGRYRFGFDALPDRCHHVK